MLTKRIIPCLDMDAGRVVKGVKFLSHRDAGDPVELAASIFHFGVYSIAQAKEYLAQRGVPVRQAATVSVRE